MKRFKLFIRSFLKKFKFYYHYYGIEQAYHERS
jgi:hypothetical protein